MTTDIPVIVYVLYEEYYGDPGPPSYNIIGVYRSIDSALSEKDSLKSFPMNKMCSYSIYSFELGD